MRPDGLVRTGNGDGSGDVDGAAASSLHNGDVAEERRKYIEDVDDLDLYMKIYPEVKRRRDEAERQVQLVEAEIKRREELRFFAAGRRTFCSEIVRKFRSVLRAKV